MNVASNWKIVWDPTATPWVALDFAEKLTDELKLSSEQQVDVRRPIDGAAAQPIARNLVAETLQFTVLRDYADDATARNAILSGKAALPYGLTKPLRVLVSGGLTYNYTAAALKSVTTQIQIVGVARVAWTYAFIASGFGL